MPKSGASHRARQDRRPVRRAALLGALEGHIEEICRDMAVQVKRMRQLHEQADELRTAFRQWTSGTKAPRGFTGLVVAGLALCAATLAAQDFDRYRQFELGSDVAAVSTVTGSAPSDLRVIHQRPALMQELIWRPKYALRQPAVPDMQSIEQIVFTFHENRLFRVAIDYEQAQTRGMVDADMVEAVSVIYGPSLLASAPRTPPGVAAYGEPGTLVAQWGTVDDSVKLYRSASYGTRFRLILTAESLSGAANRDAARALVLDAREAPAREAARQKKAAEDRSAADEKARSANRVTFRP